MKELDIESLDEFEAFVFSLAPLLGNKRLVLLSGEMGSGKTQWVKSYLKTLGIESETASPSFALHHNYEGGEENIDHVDLYRLESMEDLESTGFWDLFDKSRGIIVVEWADRLPYDYYPPNWPQLRIELSRCEGKDQWRRICYSMND